MSTRQLALVTGASGGIGGELARQLAIRGCDLIVTGRRSEALEKLKEQIESAHPVRVRPLTLDLAESGAAERLQEEVGRLEPDRPVSILVNNAGFGQFGPLLAQQPELLEALAAVNMLVPLRLVRLLGPGMQERGQGYILNVASFIALQPAPRLALYSATKAFMLALSESLALELAPHGVRVCALCPGLTDTSFFSRADWKQSPFRRVLTLSPRQVARAGIDGMYRGRRLVVPGWSYRLSAFVMRFLPRWLRLRMASLLVGE